MNETVLPTDKFVKDWLLDGNVTINLVVIVACSIGVAISILLWIIYRFQTKEDARSQERRIQSNLDKEASSLRTDIVRETTTLKGDLKDVHNHLHIMRTDMKTEQTKMQDGIAKMQDGISKLGSDISYLRAKAEPR